ncbi:MAG: hypothetical protein KDD36_11010 [Flavobacteriales bacterium]|nr:hypothetical protein [Flavobacteriales bacterium]
MIKTQSRTHNSKALPVGWVLPMLAVITFMSACELINPDEQIPTYLRIDQFNLTTNQASEGSARHKITDAWVYIDDQAIGAFELPARVPVPYSGSHKVTIYPGIKMNGISATRVIYPFFTSYNQTLDLVPAETITLNPTTTYTSFTQFAWMETFDNAGFSLEKTSKSDTTMTKALTADIFEGKGSGRIYLDTGDTLFEAKSTDAFKLPKGEAIFLEMHYKCNHPFVVGLIANGTQLTTQFPVFSFNPTTEWNKIYINLTQEVGNQNNIIDYNVFIGVSRDGSYAVNPEIFLDNFKLVY